MRRLLCIFAHSILRDEPIRHATTCRIASLLFVSETPHVKRNGSVTSKAHLHLCTFLDGIAGSLVILALMWRGVSISASSGASWHKVVGRGIAVSAFMPSKLRCGACSIIHQQKSLAASILSVSAATAWTQSSALSSYMSHRPPRCISTPNRQSVSTESRSSEHLRFWPATLSLDLLSILRCCIARRHCVLYT